MIELPKGYLYNTAIKSRQRANVTSSTRKLGGIFSGNGLKVFQHDLCSGIHPLFREADVIYSEPAWNNGYGIFTENTIAEKTNWKDYVKAIDYICRTLQIPAFILAGKQFLKLLHPDRVRDVRFIFHHDPRAFLLIYNYDGDISALNDEEQAKDFVARSFDTILDFSCGYGTLAYYIQGYHKQGILSDINADCIKYIVQHFERQDNE